jgi:KUP system potassium uptake protein
MQRHLTRMTQDTPAVMLWHVKHNRALHKYLIAITCQTESIPFVDAENRVELQQVAPDFWRMIARYGFMERPDIPVLLALGRQHGYESVIHRALGPAMPHWQEAIYAFMLRNAATVAGFFRLPHDGVVEIGRIVEI